MLVLRGVFFVAGWWFQGLFFYFNVNFGARWTHFDQHIFWMGWNRHLRGVFVFLFGLSVYLNLYDFCRGRTLGNRHGVVLGAGVHFETLTHTGHRHVRHIIQYEEALCFVTQSMLILAYIVWGSGTLIYMRQCFERCMFILGWWSHLKNTNELGGSTSIQQH